MINFMLGTPAFVSRLIPVLNLKHEFLLDALSALLTIVHQAGGYVFGFVTDNLSVNKKAFKHLHQSHTATSISSVEHPIENEHFSLLYTFYDTTHLFKNIRNNWVTEKTKTLEMLDPDNDSLIVAKWQDLVDIYTIEEKNIVKKVPFGYSSLYPNNFEKQKVQLVINIFKEKTVACLEIPGRKDTARFVALITKMWNILNIKTYSTGNDPNDPDRLPFFTADDQRLEFLLKLACSFKLMGNSKRGIRYKGLTSETSDALHKTLNAIIDIIKHLLASGFDYVLPGKIQSDRLEAEFGIYRSSSGSNYFISVEQVVNSLSMRRLKLYNKLDIEQPDNISLATYCTYDISRSDEDMELVEKSFAESSNLDEEERSSLYYISGYVAFKEGLGVHTDKSEINSSDSEFLRQVSRGKLSHPQQNIYDISLYYYSFSKGRKQKCCSKIFLQAYGLIHNATDYCLPNVEKINRRFSNCFFKAFIKKESDTLFKLKKLKKDSLKKRKLDN